MKKLFYATKNKFKIQNMKDRLKGFEIELVTPYDIEFEIDVNESGNTVIDNAVLKVKAYYEKVKLPTIAGDSSLFIEKFASQPGLFVMLMIKTKEIKEDEFILTSNICKLNKNDDALGRLEFDKKTNKYFCEMTEEDKKERNYTFDKECVDFIMSNI